MANGYKGDVARLVNSDYLYKVLKLEDDRVKAKLKDEIYTTKTITVVDTPEYYDNASVGDSGALKVVTVVSDPSTEIALTDINTQSTPVDLSSLTGDGTEYVKLIPAVTHDEPYTDTIYRKKEDSYSSKEIDDKLMEIASGGLKPETIDEYKAFMDALEITADGYIEPQP